MYNIYLFKKDRDPVEDKSQLMYVLVGFYPLGLLRRAAHMRSQMLIRLNLTERNKKVRKLVLVLIIHEGSPANLLRRANIALAIPKFHFTNFSYLLFLHSSSLSLSRCFFRSLISKQLCIVLIREE